MTDVYGASTLAGASRMSNPWYIITLMHKGVTPGLASTEMPVLTPFS